MITAAGSSNGRTRDFESRYLGPTPSPAAVIESLYSFEDRLPAQAGLMVGHGTLNPGI